jgi:phytoene/squalene synthetase
LKDEAMRLGSAFQKVNFLRDLKCDTEILNRNYFPNLENNFFNEKAKSEIILEIEADFKIALGGIKKLPFEARFGVYTAYIYYKKLLQKLKSTSCEDIGNERIRVSNVSKTYLLSKSFLRYKLNLI